MWVRLRHAEGELGEVQEYPHSKPRAMALCMPDTEVSGRCEARCMVELEMSDGVGDACAAAICAWFVTE